MSNPYRGEVNLRLDNQTYVMRLHLGALQELESALDVPDLIALVKRFETAEFSTQDVVAVLLAGLRGGGWDGDRADLLNAQIEGGVIAAARAAGRLLALSFQMPDE